MQTGNRGFRSIFIAVVSVVLVGLGLVLWSRTLSVYAVPFPVASEAFAAWCSPESKVDGAAGARYLAMFGWRYTIANIGIFLLTTGIVAGALVLALREKNDLANGLPIFRTPRHRATFVAIGIGQLALFGAGVLSGIQLDFQRQYFPACADSIAIPAVGIMTGLVVLVPVLAIVGGAITLAFGRLPAPLDQWDHGHPIRSWVVTIAFATAMVFGAGMAVLSMTAADMIGPATVIALYLLASTRAALLAPAVKVDMT